MVRKIVDCSKIHTVYHTQTLYEWTMEENKQTNRSGPAADTSMQSKDSIR